MPEGLLHLFSARPLTDIVRDLLDIIIVAYIVYRALLVLRGTRAMQMGVGLIIVAVVYAAARFLKLITLVNLLSWLLSSIVLIVVVIFQNDIRRALIRMGSKTWFQAGREQQSRVIDEVVAAATELARHRIGALIAFEQDANILEFVKSEGTNLDSTVTRELLVALFVPEERNKLHDGAVLIRDLKIAQAGVIFPMPDTKILDASLGTRHRAALGITEETDAVVVVVSEERGAISFCFSGNIVQNLDGPSLRNALRGLFGGAARKKRGGVTRKPASTGRPTTPSPGAATTTSPPTSTAPATTTGVPGAPPVKHAAAEPASTSTASASGPLSAAVPRAPSMLPPSPSALPALKASTPTKVATSTPMRPSEPADRARGSGDAAPASTPAPPSTTSPPSTVTPPSTTSAPRPTFVPGATTTPVSGSSGRPSVVEPSEEDEP